MSHTCGRASSGKIFSIFSSQSKNTHTKCCCVTNLTAPSKNCNYLNKTDGKLKSKRLKTRKERSQMRGGWTETSKAKSHHHHCHCKSRRDTVFFQSCCHNSDHQTSKRNTPISSVVPAAQEPSIITESRLIGHHRLFNHEVKSIDIERLLSTESKFKHNKKKEAGENNKASSASHMPVQLSSDDDVTVTEKAEPDAKTYDTPQETEVKNLPGSDISPGQRVLRHTDVSSGSFKSIISAKHSSHSVETKKTTKCLKSTKKRKHHLTPPADLGDLKTPNSKVTTHMISDLGGPLGNQNHQIQADDLKSGLLPLSSSPTIDSVNIQHRRHDPEHVAKTVTAVAARLCGSLRLPFVKRHSPLSESRNVLQKVLQKRHGPWLQANLLEIQRCVGHDMNPTQASMDTENTVMKKDELLVTDTSVRTTGSRPFSWESSPQLHQGLQQTAEESINPMDPSDNFLEKNFRPSFSHRCINFEPFGAAANNLFACSSKLFQEEKASSSDFWEDLRSKKEDSAQFKASPNSFMNPTRNDTDISSEQQQHYINIHPFFPFQVGHPEDLIEFPQEQNPFETDRYSLPSSFSTQIQHHLQPFHQLSTHPTFRPHHADMMLYPPSYMLELSPAPPSSSLPSPEHWSFPPMRLY